MSVKCGQTNVPMLDETPLECGGKYTSSDCIVFKEANTYLSLAPNSSATETIRALYMSLKEARDRIQILEDNQ